MSKTPAKLMSVYPVLFLGVIAISFASILIKFCQAPAMVIASYRMSFATLFFAVTAGVRRVNPLASFCRRDLFFALLSGLFLCLHFATWITSLKYTSVASSVVLVATAPVFVALASFIFLKQKPTILVLVSIFITILGAFILSIENLATGENLFLGDLLALVGAIGAAGYYLVGRELRARIDTVAYVSVVYFATALFLVIITMTLRFPFFEYPPKVFLLLFLIAFVPQVLGHTSFNWALKYVSASLVTIVTLGEPIGASILAYFLLGEKMSVLQLFGGLLILTGVASAILAERR
ncbi:MAG: DMT family transporter [bacterium]